MSRSGSTTQTAHCAKATPEGTFAVSEYLKPNLKITKFVGTVSGFATGGVPVHNNVQFPKILPESYKSVDAAKSKRLYGF